jgi:hypothetical protein
MNWLLKRLAVCCFAAMAGPAHADDGLRDFQFVPGEKVGPIGKNTSEAELKTLLPIGQVKRVVQHMGEGVFQCGTEAFSGTDNGVFIIWKSLHKDYISDGPGDQDDCERQPAPTGVLSVIIGESAERPGQWRDAAGIHVGMDLRALEKTLVAPFSFSLCPCDSGGVIFTPNPHAGLKGMVLWLQIPVDSEEEMKDLVNADAEYEIRSSDIPPDRVKDFPLRKIRVDLGG